MICYFLVAPSAADDMLQRYKSLMKTDSPVSFRQEQEKIAPIIDNHVHLKSAKNLLEDIQEIKALKQGTFEATKDFNERRSKKITEFDSKIKFFAQNGAQEYSAGTATMKSYDADSEVMTLSLSWDDRLKSMLPDIKNLKTVTTHIARDEAKRLFGKRETHFFYINVAFRDSALYVSKMILYEKYELIAKEQRNMSAISATIQPHRISKISVSSSSKEAVPFQTAELGKFLKDFYKSGNSNNISESLKYYTYPIEDYFGKHNLSKKAIFRDKKYYYNRWPGRSYQLIGYKIIRDENIADIRYITVVADFAWEVSSRKKRLSGLGKSLIKIKYTRGRPLIYSVSEYLER